MQLKKRSSFITGQPIGDSSCNQCKGLCFPKLIQLKLATSQCSATQTREPPSTIQTNHGHTSLAGHYSRRNNFSENQSWPIDELGQTVISNHALSLKRQHDGHQLTVRSRQTWFNYDGYLSPKQANLVSSKSCHIIYSIILGCLLCSSMSIQFNRQANRQVANKFLAPILSKQTSPWLQSRSNTSPFASGRSDRLVKLRLINDALGVEANSHRVDASLAQRLVSIQSQLMSLRRQFEAELISEEKQQQAVVLGINSPCLKTTDCIQRVANSHCKSDNFTCACLPLHVEFNPTTCLAPSLLGFECKLDAQCQQKVANSKCSQNDGKCICADNFVPYRRDKCLAASKINDYCLNNDQCQLNDRHSYCKWKIPHVYGQCKCPPNYKLIASYQTNETGSSGLKCAPRLGDTCLTDEECLQVTKNSHCKEPQLSELSSDPSSGENIVSNIHRSQRRDYLTGHLAKASMISYRIDSLGGKMSLNWPTSGASSRRCQCLQGFTPAPNQLECLDTAAAGDTDTFAKHHHYDMIGPVIEAKRSPVIVASNRDPQKPLEVSNAPLGSTILTEQRNETNEELNIKLLPGIKPGQALDGSVGLSSGSSKTTTTTTTASMTSTSTTSRPLDATVMQQQPLQTLKQLDQNGASVSSPNQKQLQVAKAELGGNGNKAAHRTSSLGKPCSSSRECQARDPHSDCIGGICECLKPSPRCRASSNGCHKETFQCRNGQCISWYFVCDQFRNCDDGSDEDECKPNSCPPEAFQCQSDGQCLNLGKLCNGVADCLDGSDEIQCNDTKWTNGTTTMGIGYNFTLISSGPQSNPRDASLSSSPDADQMIGMNRTGRQKCHSRAFTCLNGQCLPAYVFCNAVIDCADGSDELESLCDRQTLVGTNLRRRKPTLRPSSNKPRPNQTKRSSSGGIRTPSSFASSTNGLLQVARATSYSASESPIVKLDRNAIEQLLGGFTPASRDVSVGGVSNKNNLASEGKYERRHGVATNERVPSGARRQSRLLGSAHECPRDSFTCGTGKCRSSAILCSGVDGCGDNSDEDHCEVCQCEPPH